MMNFGQVENCFDFISGCIKQHGKKIKSVNIFKEKFKGWIIQVAEREMILKEYQDGTKTFLSSDLYLKVILENGEHKISGTGKNLIENEKRLIETLMLFNGDISHKDYANEA